MTTQDEQFRLNSTRAIKEWTRQYFGLQDDIVLVAEVNCAEPNCPDKETMITVFRKDGAPGKFNIRKPLVYVRKWDVETLARQFKEQFNG